MLRAISPRQPLVNDALLQSEMNAVALRFGGRVATRLGTYPPQMPTTSGYKRTGTLGRNWRASVARQGGGIVVTVENPTPYAPFVEGSGDEQTAEMHRRGWPRVDEVAEKEFPAAQADFSEVLARAAP